MTQKASLQELDAILTGYWLTDLANFSAWLFHSAKDVNWSGFYLDDGQKLRLGPFSGKPACVEIEYSRGVCGAAFSKKEIQRVADVHDFPGHIACDPNSRSELVLPFWVNGKLVGVLDIDSPLPDRFTAQDEIYFSQALEILSKHLKTIGPF